MARRAGRLQFPQAGGRARGSGSPQLLAILSTVLGLAACGDAPDPNAPVLTRSDSAGVLLVTSRGSGWAETDAWRLVRDLEIGETDGPFAFGRLVDVAPRRDGGLWVVDAQARRIRGFDEAGREVLGFGREGAGPGELRSAGEVTERPDGRLVVGGRMPVVLHVFGPDGRPLYRQPVPPTTYRAPRGPDGEAPPPGPSLGAWRFAADATPFLQVSTLDAPDGQLSRTDVVLRVPADTSGAPAPRSIARWNSGPIGTPGGPLRPFEPKPSWTPVSDGGAWLADGSSYEIRRVDAAGTLRSVLRRPVPRHPIDEDAEAAFRAELAGAVEGTGALGMLDTAEFPDSLPAIVDLWGGEPTGHLWVGVIDPALGLELDRPNAWDLFRPDGTYVGRLPIPDGFRPTRVTPSHVYGISLDDLDIPRARRYRIIRSDGVPRAGPSKRELTTG